jgi:hypothetical protein
MDLGVKGLRVRELCDLRTTVWYIVLMMQGLRVKRQKVQATASRVQGVGSRVQGAGCRV